MSDLYCPTCGEFRFSAARHTCPPKWYAIEVDDDMTPDTTPDGRSCYPVQYYDEPVAVYASDAGAAAEKYFGRDFDSESQEGRIFVLKAYHVDRDVTVAYSTKYEPEGEYTGAICADEGEVIKAFDVSVEYDPTFHAQPVDTAVAEEGGSS